MKRIYLDHAATTPLCKEAFCAVTDCLSGCFGNPDSVHSFGREAEKVLRGARDKVAELMGADPSEIVFTSGGTEADNAALKGVAAVAGKRRHILISAVEHPAVYAAAEQLREAGFWVGVIPADGEGFVTPEALLGALREDTLLVSVMWANNVFGTLEDIPELARAAHSAGALFHTDAVQAAGALEVDAGASGADLISVSAHKMYGPKGAGALYVRRGTPFLPLIAGGEQERGLRGGTSVVHSAAGFAAAFAATRGSAAEDAARMRELRDFFLGELLSADGVTLVGASDMSRRHPGNACVRVVGVRAGQLLAALDLEGVAASAGSACSARLALPDRSLTALGMTETQADECVRFSLGRETQKEELVRAAEIFRAAVRRIRKA